MAYDSPSITIGTLTAAADLSSKQYHFVKLASATTVNVCTAITDVPIGILQNNPDTAGYQCIVQIFGLSKVVADGTLAAGNIIGTSADSQADAITRGSDNSVTILGQAVQAASAGETCTMFLNLSNARAY